MDEPLPVLDSPRNPTPPPAMSLAARLLNVFAVPGQVFADVKAGPICIANWLVPALLSTFIAVLTTVVVLSQPAFQRQMNELTERQAKVLDQQVKAGKLKQADADRFLALARTVMEPRTWKTLLTLAAAAVGVARVFWWAFVLWLLARLFLKLRLGYLKLLEVAGLGLMISVLGAIVTLLLMLNLPGLIATPNLASAISDIGAVQKSALLLGAAYVFAFWLIGVLSVGLAKLAGAPIPRAVWLVFASWLVQESFVSFVVGVAGQFAL
jgi:hypothetical protein